MLHRNTRPFINNKISRLKTKTFVERAKGNLSDSEAMKKHHISIERRSQNKGAGMCNLI